MVKMKQIRSGIKFVVSEITAGKILDYQLGNEVESDMYQFNGLVERIDDENSYYNRMVVYKNEVDYEVLDENCDTI